MNGFAQWFNDWRWAFNMVRARRYRRTLLFSRRLTFDRAIRPHRSNHNVIVDYPAALYMIEYVDLQRAITATEMDHVS